MPTDTLSLLGAGKAFADLSSWRVIAVTGGDAVKWLNDLVSTEVSDLEPGTARQGLLLARTGGVRAAFTVAATADALLLVQDPSQPSIADLLGLYVLSSDVELTDRTEVSSLFSIPGADVAPPVSGATTWSPTCLGVPGIDVLVPAADHDDVARLLAGTLAEAGPDDLEAFRIARGVPRIGVDVAPEDLPQESGLDAAVTRGKGCYVGQEAVAKVDNLGHPRRVLVTFTADGSVEPGAPVLADGVEAGTVTSAVRLEAGTRGLVKIRWRSRDQALATSDGVALTLTGHPAP
jgi:folate-binding protein YgfZ